jgi:D-glycero-alpha-D-manno-heptose-7-phosphate kinase
MRVSLFGGGSDYPEWYHRHPGAVLGFTIDKYIYVSAIPLPPFVEYRYRIAYSRLETVNDISEIRHPTVRSVLRHEGFTTPMDYSIHTDLPGNAGLGGSSAFTVGFINLISSLKGLSRTSLEIARLAIEMEHEVLGERVGIQDQLHAAFGGLNHFTFEGEQFAIHPVSVSGADLARLSEWMVLVYTGIKRHATRVLRSQVARTREHKLDSELQAMVDLVSEGRRVFETTAGDRLPPALAGLLQESWVLKKRLSPSVSSPAIDDLYDRCCSFGALAGKLCGAGGGGFLLMVVPPDRRSEFRARVGPDRCVNFRIEQAGSTVARPW